MATISHTPCQRTLAEVLRSEPSDVAADPPVVPAWYQRAGESPTRPTIDRAVGWVVGGPGEDRPIWQPSLKRLANARSPMCFDPSHRTWLPTRPWYQLGTSALVSRRRVPRLIVRSGGLSEVPERTARYGNHLLNALPTHARRCASIRAIGRGCRPAHGTSLVPARW